MAGKILISTTSFGQYDPEPLQLLKKGGYETLLNPLGKTMKPEELLTHAKDCIGIVAGTELYTADTLSHLKGLQVISRCGAGLDSIDLNAAEQHGIQIVSTPLGPTQAVAELTLGLILDLLRHISSSNVKIRKSIWEKDMGFLVGEMKFGILGLGRIGRSVAALLRRFDATVFGYDIHPDRAWAAAHNVILRERNYVLQEADVVCLHLPYEKSLHHLIGRDALAMMRPGSFLINTSRGGIIDEDALVASLRSNHLRGAAIDTFEQEPYAGPLRELDNVILTPHIGSYARAGRIHMERESVENLIKALQERTAAPAGSPLLREER